MDPGARELVRNLWAYGISMYFVHWVRCSYVARWYGVRCYVAGVEPLAVSSSFRYYIYTYVLLVMFLSRHSLIRYF